MKRHELTLPLRIGPWWVGMLMILPLLPLMLVSPFIEGFATFGRGIREQVLDLRAAVATIWADRR